MSQSSSCKLGVNVDERTTEPRFELGELTFGTGGETLLYAQASTGVAANVAVLVNAADFTFAAGAGKFNSGAVAWNVNEFGWVIKSIEV
jgi:hypothetical protein